MRNAIRFALITAASTAFAQPALAKDTEAATASAADDTTLSFTTGIDYSSGSYGAPIDTKITVVPLTARLKTGDWRITASVPWLRIDGAKIVGGGAGGPIVIDPNAPRTVREGIGDVSVGLTYAIPEERLGIGLEFTGRVKLPTASTSKGLGTGKTDVSGMVDISKSIGPVTPFIDLGYRIPGDPAGINLSNSFFGSAGFSVAAGKAVVIASYDYRESASALAKDSHELFGALSVPVAKPLDFTLYGTAGLSKGAPDYGVGAMITFKAF